MSLHFVLTRSPEEMEKWDPPHRALLAEFLDF